MPDAVPKVGLQDLKIKAKELFARKAAVDSRIATAAEAVRSLNVRFVAGEKLQKEIGVADKTLSELRREAESIQDAIRSAEAEIEGAVKEQHSELVSAVKNSEAEYHAARKAPQPLDLGPTV